MTEYNATFSPSQIKDIQAPVEQGQRELEDMGRDIGRDLEDVAQKWEVPLKEWAGRQ